MPVEGMGYLKLSHNFGKYNNTWEQLRYRLYNAFGGVYIEVLAILDLLCMMVIMYGRYVYKEVTASL